MNILIVGNGFDLSHYLPTKYDHFMDVMRAIEEKDTGEKVKDLSIHKVDEWIKQIDKIFEKRNERNDPNYSMDFDELFSKTRDSYFIEKTKEFYLTEQVELDSKDVLKLQYRLELNSWYKYFKNHVAEIKTWIDFEQKIEEVLAIFGECILEIEQVKRPNELFEYFSHEQEEGHRINERNFKILSFFNFITSENYKINLPIVGEMSAEGKLKDRSNINPKFCHGGKVENGFNPSGFIGYLYQQLDDFIAIFDLYLELIICQLNSRFMLEIDEKEWIYPDKIFSFNYTNTYQRIHDSVDVEYLHGSHGKYQNIVLGVSDLEDESLKKIKAYGFTKYHQKLFKDTDYWFLDKYKQKIKQHNLKIEYFEKDSSSDDPTVKKFTRQQLMEKESKLNLNIYIWGHSLDVSDKDYIIDLFRLNDDIDRNVRVTVYYFNKTAKFDLLNNLLAILGKDKVEHWMKKKWLVFKLNPEIKPVLNLCPETEETF